MQPHINYKKIKVISTHLNLGKRYNRYYFFVVGVVSEILGKKFEFDPKIDPKISNPKIDPEIQAPKIFWIPFLIYPFIIV